MSRSAPDPTLASVPEPLPPLAAVRFDVVATIAFVVIGCVAVAIRTSTAGKVLIIATSMALFVVGVFAALAAYASALERSRTDEIGVAQLYLVTGKGTAPALVKLALWTSLLLQIATGVIVATVGATDLREGQLNALAFAVLAPMFGIGLNGWWMVRHGKFGPRIAPQRNR